MAGCEYIIGNKKYTEQELKDFLQKLAEEQDTQDGDGDDD